MTGVCGIGVFHSVTAKKTEECIDIRQRYRFDQGQIHIIDGYLIQWCEARHAAFFNLNITKKSAQV